MNVQGLLIWCLLVVCLEANCGLWPWNMHWRNDGCSLIMMIQHVDSWAMNDSFLCVHKDQIMKTHHNMPSNFNKLQQINACKWKCKKTKQFPMGLTSPEAIYMLSILIELTLLYIRAWLNSDKLPNLLRLCSTLCSLNATRVRSIHSKRNRHVWQG